MVALILQEALRFRKVAKKISKKFTEKNTNSFVKGLLPMRLKNPLSAGHSLRLP